LRLLLDTHALIWLLSGSTQLSVAARHAITATADVTFVSAATAWEVSTKHRLGKLPDAARLAQNFEQIVAEEALEQLPITVRHGHLAGNLRGVQKDPFDRMLIAQALLENLLLVSNETAFDAFGVSRLW
jgi:PIN domain nuclease of toxin-antitoxin system